MDKVFAIKYADWNPEPQHDTKAGQVWQPTYKSSFGDSKMEKLRESCLVQLVGSGLSKRPYLSKYGGEQLRETPDSNPLHPHPCICTHTHMHICMHTCMYTPDIHMQG